MKSFLDRRAKLFTILFPLICVALYVALCCLNISGSIWFDESYSHYLIRGDFKQIWQFTAIDVHPPFFYYLLKTWSLIFGTSVVALRFMSVFFGVVAIALAFFALKRHANLRAAALGTLFLAICPMFVRFGVEMRMYTFILALVIGATDVMLCALKSDSWKLWILYAILICLGMWTHYFCALAWVSHLIYIIYYYRKNKSPQFKTISLTYGLAILLYLPWIPALLQQINSIKNGFWIPPISINTITNLICEVFFFADRDHTSNSETATANTSGWLMVLLLTTIALLIILLVKLRQVTKKSEHGKSLPLTLLITIPPVLLILISLPPRTSMFINRYILYSIAGLWLGFGLLLYAARVHAKDKIINLTSLALAAALLITATIGNYNVATREPKSYTADIFYSVTTLDDEAGDNFPILATGDWDYYDLVAYDSPEHQVYFYRGWGEFKYGSQEPISSFAYHVFDDLGTWVKEHPSFWLIVGKGNDLPEELQNYRAATTVTGERHTAYLLHKP